MSLKFQTCIMYPNSSTSLILGRRLLREEHDLFLYCPQDCHRRMAHTIPVDLQMACLGLSMTVKETATLEHLGNMDNIIFPTIDVLPDKKRVEFARIMGKLFRLIKYWRTPRRVLTNESAK